MPHILNVPNFKGSVAAIELNEGNSTFFIGANGTGKSRLAVLAENQFQLLAHRISAHRSLNLNPDVAKISQNNAIAGLRTGYAQEVYLSNIGNRVGGRWNSKAATSMLNDFDFLIQSLFAEQSNIEHETHKAAHSGNITDLKFTKFQILVRIWDRILPHRSLEISGDNIKTIAANSIFYSASDMSDGERAVFYLLGQVLMAAPNSVLIFDEPELHIHRAILSSLWDEVETVRSDCAFLVISHDLEFVASRNGKKFAICNYEMPDKWELEEVLDGHGFSEEIATLILGSRKPILFVEGTNRSLDLEIYRACYTDWTVIPRGSCEEVIHAVVTMRANSNLTRVTCSGLVDADDYSKEDQANLANFGVMVLPVSEIENLFLLPEISKAILKSEGYSEEEVKVRQGALKDEVIAEVRKNGAINDVLLRYLRRRIDRTLKKIDLKAHNNVEDLSASFTVQTKELDIDALAKSANVQIINALEANNLNALLAVFDSKAFLAMAAKHLKSSGLSEFKKWLIRAMRRKESSEFKVALQSVLPKITPA